MVRLKRQKVCFKKKNREMKEQPPARLRSILRFAGMFAAVFLVGAALVALKYAFVDSDYFLLKDVEVTIVNEEGIEHRFGPKDTGIDSFLGENIFFIDLKKVKREIEENRREFKDIVVKRVLPDRLLVQGKLRRPVAQVYSDRYYPVDNEGVLLPDVSNFPRIDLPIIKGTPLNLARVSSATIDREEGIDIMRAIFLINQISSNPQLKKHNVKLVDITDPGNIILLFEDFNTEIKIGNSDFKKRLDTLAAIISQMGDDIKDFRYIDLRFEDPIMGPR